MNKYEPATIERKWAKNWRDRKTNLRSQEDLRSAQRPYYNLMMFPYPSAEGLHVGNMYAFTGADVYGRYQELLGQTVLEPIGFDAFGIHSENFALKQGVHPMDLIPKNIQNFTRQLNDIGGMYDWDHTVDTTDPEYYKWTQWIFLQLFKAGLAERKKAPVNWCPSCMTVLANEQVIQNLCERCDSPVEQRQIAQWFFKITEYASRLLSNLDSIDWSESTKKAQSNWIGRSEGAVLRFPITTKENASYLEVFTTRPDTIFGTTFIVLAPEHPLVDALTIKEKQTEVAKYKERAKNMDLVSRQKEVKDKTGVFTGAYCTNPASDEKIPVWIADYVLMGYGTGAIMAVPAHDQRDFDFAQAMGLEIRQVIQSPVEHTTNILSEAYTDEGLLINSKQFDGLNSHHSKRKITEWLDEKGLGKVKVNYRLRDWCISRQRYWGPPIPIVNCKNCGPVPVPEEELPVMLPRIDDFKPDESGISPLARVADWYETKCPKCGNSAKRETDVSDTFLDSSWYFLRYPSTDNKERPFDDDITKHWLPVDSYIGGNEHAVLHLMYARFITMVLKDLGHIEFEEPFSRFRAHGLITRNGAKMSKSRGNVITPDAIINKYGADTFRTYLMFMGPLEEGGDYRDDGIQGPVSFLNRLWETAYNAEETKNIEGSVEQKLHKTIKQVTQQIPELAYNTAIAAMMEYLNVLRSGGRQATTAEVTPLIVMIAPFAPHLAEELWELLGNTDSIFTGRNWPSFDPEKATDKVIEIGVQVNGKLRGTIIGLPDMTDKDAEQLAREEENVSRYLEGRTVKRVIFVPGRLLNFVI